MNEQDRYMVDHRIEMIGGVVWNCHLSISGEPWGYLTSLEKQAKEGHRIEPSSYHDKRLFKAEEELIKLADYIGRVRVMLNGGTK